MNSGLPVDLRHFPLGPGVVPEKEDRALLRSESPLRSDDLGIEDLPWPAVLLDEGGHIVDANGLGRRLPDAALHAHLACLPDCGSRPILLAECGYYEAVAGPMRNGRRVVHLRPSGQPAPAGLLPQVTRLAHILVLICDQRSHAIHREQGMDEVLGYHHGIEPARRLECLLHEDDVAACTAWIDAASRSEAPLEVEFRLRHADGSWRWLRGSLSAFRRENAEETAQVLAVMTDVTEPRLQAQRLQAAEERLGLIARHVPLILFQLDAAGNVVFVEGKGLEEISYIWDSADTGSIFEIFDGYPEMVQNLRLALAGGREDWNAQINGQIFDVKATVLRDELGAARGLIGVAFDRTELQRIQTQMMQSEKLAALGSLVAGIAHEINNPLAVIGGTAQLLEMHPIPQVREDAQTIRRMTERATRIVRSLLTFARGNATRSRQRSTLRQIIEDTQDLFIPQLKKAEVQLSIALASGEPSVMVNPNEIQQILLNLVTNAEHALRERATDFREIVLTTEVERDAVVLRVADNGSGIPSSVLPRIFDPFFSTKEVGSGTGLGLSICHGIAIAHQGSLTVESTEGVGTVFALRLPVAAEEIHE